MIKWLWPPHSSFLLSRWVLSRYRAYRLRWQSIGLEINSTAADFKLVCSVRPGFAPGCDALAQLTKASLPQSHVKSMDLQDFPQLTERGCATYPRHIPELGGISGF